MPTRPIAPLHADEVQVWRLRADLEGDNRAAAMLIGDAVTPDERDRAARFRQEADRQRFLQGRLLLRTFLGHHLGIAPRGVRFVNGEHGKPEVEHQAGAGILRFNLAHSGEWLLFGARARSRARASTSSSTAPMSDAILIARRFFAPPEVEALEALDPALHHDTFFRIWSRKEAIVKATGQGISAGLERFAVSCDASEDVTLRGLDGDPAWDRWTIRGLDMPPNYTAAVALRSPRRRGSHPGTLRVDAVVVQEPPRGLHFGMMERAPRSRQGIVLIRVSWRLRRDSPSPWERGLGRGASYASDTSTPGATAAGDDVGAPRTSEPREQTPRA